MLNINVFIHKNIAIREKDEGSEGQTLILAKQPLGYSLVEMIGNAF